jgi:hypothetical protein
VAGNRLMKKLGLLLSRVSSLGFRVSGRLEFVHEVNS